MGVQVGLGTDVAGGYSPSMLHAMRSCVVASRALRMQRLAIMGLQQPQPCPSSIPAHAASSISLSQAPFPQPQSEQPEQSHQPPSHAGAGSSELDGGSSKLPAAGTSTLRSSEGASPEGQESHADSRGNVQPAAGESGDIVIVPAAQRQQLEGSVLDWKAAFWLGTQGGAGALGIQDVCGSLEVGKSFDALRVDIRASTFDVFAADSQMDAFQKFVNLGDDRNIKTVWVMGRQVYNAASS